MDARPKCQQCGADLPAGLLMGLCPKCIGRVVFQLEPARTHEAVGMPRRFGDYELLEEIARGGMGVVYRARQISLNRQVALKLILAGRLAKENEVKRFRAESEAAASLDHPNIVPVFEVGEHAGQHFFSMKLVAGRSLASLVGEPASRPSPEEAARLMALVARAVHYAHQHGVLHRDLKPSNILLDANGQPHVTDFGLAKRLSANSDLTLSGAMVGSPNYMSPEQAGGKATRLTTATDVYGLGAVLYALLTGRAPFAGATPLEAIRQLAESEPVRPRALCPSLDRDLETICLKCLEKAPEHRYGSAEALADELERWQRGEPILARPCSLFQRGRKWVRRHPAPALLLVSCASLVLAGIVAVVWAWRQAEVAHQESYQNQRRAEQAERAAVDELRDAYLAQAHASRLSAQAGRRFDSLAALAKAAAIRPGMDLRNEAIACLALTDVRALRTITCPDHATAVSQPDDAWQRYALGLPNGQIIERSLDDDRELLRFSLSSPAADLLLSHTGRWLAARCRDGKLRIWDLRNQHLALTTPICWYNQSLDFSADDTRVAVAGTTVRVFALSSAQPVLSVPLPKTQPRLVAFSPNGARLAVADDQGPVFIFDSRSGVLLTNLPHPVALTAMAWHPDNRRLATASYDRNVRLWDTVEGRLLLELAGHGEEVHTVAFHPAGDLLLSSGFDGVIFWSAETGQMLFRIEGLQLNAKVAPSGRRLSTMWFNHRLHLNLWELAHGRPVMSLGSKAPWPAGNMPAFSPDGRLLVQGDGRRVWWFDSRTGKRLAQVTLPEFSWLAFDSHSNFWSGGPGGLYASSFSPGAAAGEWDLAPPGPIARALHDADWYCPCLAPGGDFLVVSHHGHGHQHLFRTDAGRPIARTPDHSESDYSALSRGGRLLATGNARSDQVTIWQRLPGQPQFRELLKLRQQAAFCGMAQFLAHDSRLAVDWGTKVTLYDTKDWQPLWSHPVNDAIAVFACARKGKFIAVRSERHFVHLLAAKTGELLATLQTPNGLAVKRLAFSPDDAQLATTTEGTRELFIWDLRGVRRELASLGLDWKPSVPSVAGAPSTAPGQCAQAGGEPRLRVLQAGSGQWEKPRWKIPARAAGLPASLLDLSPYYNVALSEPAPGEEPDNTLASLHAGVQRLGGIDYDIRGRVQLRAKALFQHDYPARVEGIPLGRACRRLHFLCATVAPASSGAHVGSFTLLHSSGRADELPLIFGGNIEDWWSAGAQGTHRPKPVWTGQNLATRLSGGHLELYEITWVNPAPADPVASISFVSSLQDAAPFLMAITTD
jgi:eukaryotic-like serine/threonine-protein kinase